MNNNGEAREKALDKIQVAIIPISLAASVIAGQILNPGLVLTGIYTLTGGNFAILVFRKVAGLLPPPKK